VKRDDFQPVLIFFVGSVSGRRAYGQATGESRAELIGCITQGQERVTKELLRAYGKEPNACSLVPLQGLSALKKLTPCCQRGLPENSEDKSPAFSSTKERRRDRPNPAVTKTKTYPRTSVISIPVSPFQSFSISLGPPKLRTKYEQECGCSRPSHFHFRPFASPNSATFCGCSTAAPGVLSYLLHRKTIPFHSDLPIWPRPYAILT
jgi:hypothetical protein